MEEKLSLDSLHELHKAFKDVAYNNEIELEQFKDIVKNALKIQGRVIYLNKNI